MALYHANVFLPRKVRNIVQRTTTRPHYTYHAKNAANTDRYGQVKLPDVITFGPEHLIEIETYKAKPLAKIVVRLPYTDSLDLVMALCRESKQWIVKTVWINEANDSHATLDANRYERQ